ncbi:pyrroline-5-carboxylate reductase [Tetragenococcus koreensis]|uniref:Pyrroline-5-carboxylate reductase n=1 Tax=Tetragenococcus koreensis TaxID=290335 RepID=A0AAN4UAZ9_9ENTE|nr:pyrroline-5-carboxylate reductase [Tetragenococcus koreensis]GEQ49443.1 pyrroline-5-carboxylate reductase [Tetragenococcus koreensis]GEQ51710.1 pyrroline-5-carboxylate reductase [Tetragenococcus koreensis]GEQ54295.1 pyrroline-5-carboxylate reductase [Tetragenococcus koreensis]GEQ56671.1 pyrroline-5-carboxylate reductase [Tetragenococcus koreensis]GEQ59456.1 pyrroline-5-carboxylate reductase [Tetragenococcus koreensis]
MKRTIGFYGAGNMAQAIISGLINSGFYQKEEIYVYNHRYEPTLKKVEETYGIQVILREEELFQQSDLIIFAVKPTILTQILPQINPYLQKEHVLVSIAAGVSIQQIEKLTGPHKIIRAMPNTPAMVNQAMSSISPNKLTTQEEIQLVVDVFDSFGKAKVVSEELIDAVVGVSGSAPAYVYLFIEALADGAVLEGLPRDDAYEFATQAVLGAAKMVEDTGKHPGELKDMVTSPKGTTIAAVQSLEESNFRASVMKAVEAAAKKNHEMNK